MQTFQVEGVIKFFPSNTLKLEQKLELEISDSPNVSKIKCISSGTKEELKVYMTIEANSENEATTIAGMILSNLCNKLSFFAEIPILESRITGLSYFDDGKKQVTTIILLTMSINSSISMILDSNSILELKKKLTKNYSSDFEEVLLMWREAMYFQNDPLSQYLFFYRILEKIIGKKELENWFKIKEPNVPMKSNEWRNEEVPIYVWLRDNIHPKSPQFPFRELKEHLPKIYNLTKIAIQEKFSKELIEDMKIINHFNFQNNDHEKWFEEVYLKSLGLKNKRLGNKDFEGLICDDNETEFALFELKLVTMPNIQEKVNKEFENNLSESLIPFPHQDDIRKRLRDTIDEAINQLIKKEPGKDLPRIIFLIRNTPDFSKEDLIDVIKDKRLLIFMNQQPVQTFSSERSENKTVLDLFDNKKISGLICIALESEEPRYSSEIILNKKATLKIPHVFINNSSVKSIEEI